MHSCAAAISSARISGFIVNVAIADSTLSLNTANGIITVSGPGNATINVMRTVATANGQAGIESNQGNGGTASITVGSSQISGNATGVEPVGGGGLLSNLNNHLTGNASNGSFTGTAGLK